MNELEFKGICDRIPLEIVDCDLRMFRFGLSQTNELCPKCKIPLISVIDIMTDGGYLSYICENKEHFFIKDRAGTFWQTSELTDWPINGEIICKNEPINLEEN